MRKKLCQTLPSDIWNYLLFLRKFLNCLSGEQYKLTALNPLDQPSEHADVRGSAWQVSSLWPEGNAGVQPTPAIPKRQVQKGWAKLLTSDIWKKLRWHHFSFFPQAPLTWCQTRGGSSGKKGQIRLLSSFLGSKSSALPPFMPQAMHLVWLHCFWNSKQAVPGGCLKKRALILSIVSWIDSQSTRSKNSTIYSSFLWLLLFDSFETWRQCNILCMIFHCTGGCFPRHHGGTLTLFLASVKSYELFWILSTIMQVKEIFTFYLPVLNEIPCLLLDENFWDCPPLLLNISQ